MFRDKRYLLVVIVGLLLAGLVLGGCGNKGTETGNNDAEKPSSSDSNTKPADQTPKKIKVGIIETLTGAAANWGISMRNGAEMAFESVNNAGGVEIDGEKYLIEPRFEDDRWDPKETLGITEKLIDDGYRFIIGPIASDGGIAIKSLIDREKIITIMNGFSHDDTAGSAYGFSSHRDAQALHPSGFVISELGAKTLAIMVSKDDFGRGSAEATKQGFEASGGKVLTIEYFNPDEKDFYAQLSKIKKMKPDAIHIAASPTPILLAIKQIFELDAAPLVTDTGTHTKDEVMKILQPEDIKGNWYNISPGDLAPLVVKGDPTAIEFHEAYKKKYGADAPAGPVLYGYDGAMFLAEALQRAGTLDPDRIKAVLEDLSVPDGSWTFKPMRTLVPQKGKLFSPIHKIEMRYSVLRWKGDNWEFVKWDERKLED